MTIEKPINQNYCATVVEIKNVIEFDNCDNIVGTNFFGFQAVINKKTKPGTIGILFPAETRLSEKYCSENNLFRHSNLNKDESVQGYIENNRRVKAVKFRNNRSDSLFMPLSSLGWTGIDISSLKLGDEFDHLNGEQICEKYAIKRRESKKYDRKLVKIFRRVDKKFLPEHIDTSNWFKFEESIKDEEKIIVTQKLHGTSIRVANTIVKRKLNPIEWLLRLTGIKIAETEYDCVFGSRKVIKDINNPDHKHFYNEDIWTREGKKIVDSIPENFIVYGELIGWSGIGSKIQEGYTYEIEDGQSEIFIYRVAQINGQGILTDLSWDQVVDFCKQRGLKYVPELWRGEKKDFDANNYLDVKLNDQYRHCIPVGGKVVDEGICVRVEGMIPDIYKAKSPLFFEHETKLMDKGIIDLETQGSDEQTNS